MSIVSFLSESKRKSCLSDPGPVIINILEDNSIFAALILWHISSHSKGENLTLLPDQQRRTEVRSTDSFVHYSAQNRVRGSEPRVKFLTLAKVNQFDINRFQALIFSISSCNVPSFGKFGSGSGTNRWVGTLVDLHGFSIMNHSQVKQDNVCFLHEITSLDNVVNQVKPWVISIMAAWLSNVHF